MKSKIQITSYTVLLGGSFLFGLFGRPAEMGLSIAAGAIGLAFVNIDKISRFKGAGFEAEMWERFEAVVEKETEPIPESNTGVPKVEAYGTADDKARAVIKALNSPKYTWRRSIGIAQETGLNKEEVENTLDWLCDNSLGKKSKGPKGTIWNLTQKGRNVFQNEN